jgi:Mrp family chromosome partitioning ATPase
VALALAVERIHQSGYDYVVIDAPSVLHHADVNVVEEAVDAVLLAARAGSSRGRLVRRAVEQLGPEKVVGVVLVDA